MSQNQKDSSGNSPQWWESDEFSDEGYVPGSLADAAAPSASDDAARAAKEAAAQPKTQAVPVLPPATPVSPRDGATGMVPPAPEATEASLSKAPAPTAQTAVISPELSARSTSRAATRAAQAAGGPATATLPSAATEATGDVPAAPSSEDTLRASLESKPIFPRILQWLVAILTPLILLALAVRTVASGAFLWIEYHRPGFPADSFGFSTDQRMVFGSYGLNYINSFAGADYLGGLVISGTTRTLGEPSLFRPEEVGHMADVQSLVHLLYLLAVIAAVMVLISFLVLRSRAAGGIRRALFAGAWVTIGLAAVLAVLGVLGWEQFFTSFHELFFSQGNWQFYMDDTLIRLYPPQFWVDAAVVLGSLVFLVCVLIIIFAWPTRARRERARILQAKREFRLD